jgi:hypothetical protein
MLVYLRLSILFKDARAESTVFQSLKKSIAAALEPFRLPVAPPLQQGWAFNFGGAEATQPPPQRVFGLHGFGSQPPPEPGF